MDVKGGDAWSRGLFSLSDARTKSAPVEFVGTGARSISSLLGKKVESAPRGVAGIRERAGYLPSY